MSEPALFLDGDVQLWQGDVLDALERIPADHVHAIVTSPPYWNLRDYGTAEWEGGDPACDHARPARARGKDVGLNERLGRPVGAKRQEERAARPYMNECGKCGALRVDRQLGLEPIPDCQGWATGDPCGACYVCRLVAVFRACRRVLRPDGTLWLNLGDSYTSGDRTWRDAGSTSQINGRRTKGAPQEGLDVPGARQPTPPGLKEKDLIGVPWRVALALQADGWWLRADNLWNKPDGMPSSVQDRPAMCHEYLFLLTRSARYHYDHVAVKQPLAAATLEDGRFERAPGGDTLFGQENGRGEGLGRGPRVAPDGMRNLRTVWTIPTEPQQVAACDDCDAILWSSRDAQRHEEMTGHRLAPHFAAFPSRLARRALRAGMSERGCCSSCGTPLARITETERGNASNAALAGTELSRRGHPTGQVGGAHDVRYGPVATVRTIGWEPACSCGPGAGTSPCVALDPFMGSGTVALAARQLGHRSIGIELRPAYCRMIEARTRQTTLV